VGGHLFEFTHAYDNADREKATIFPDGRLVRKVLDSAGRITAIPGYVENVKYNDRGEMSEYVLGNKTVTTQTYDARRRLLTLATKDPATMVIQGYKYRYDRVSNLESLLATLQRYDIEARVVVFLEASYLAHLEKVRTRYGVDAVLTYPIQEADLEQALQKIQEV
jgi:YD repeat-containing protein